MTARSRSRSRSREGGGPPGLPVAAAVQEELSAAAAAVQEPAAGAAVAAAAQEETEAEDVEAAYSAAVRYIFSNADFSGKGRRYQNPKDNWARFDRLLEALGRPLRELKCVHIAGTNGKGTTSALCDAMLRASGVGTVGMFTSPHVHSFRERIRIDGRLISKAAVVAGVRVVKPVVEALGYASPFEKLSALALVCFRSAGVEWAVLETGVGGRWDCTNHCAPLACGLNRVGFDHMNVLGDTLEKIAFEKAGILKAGVPAFSVPQHPEAMAVLSATADEVGAPLTLCEATDDDAAALPEWLSPRHQQHNVAMALAIMASLAARGHMRADAAAAWRAARDALAWPARFETFRPAPLLGSQRLVLDVAHNEPAVEALLASVAAKWPTAPLVVIFGANSDKDVRAIVRHISRQPGLLSAIAVRSKHPKATPTGKILLEVAAAAASPPPQVGSVPHVKSAPAAAQEVTAAAPAAESPWREAPTMLEALHLAAAALGGADDGVVLCCGSVFVAADMRGALAKEHPALFRADDWAFEECNEPALLM